MDWNTIKANGQIEVDSHSYDLSHLEDARYHFTIPGNKTNDELKCELLVQYSSHCVSWGPKKNTAIDFSEHGEDRCVIDDKGIHRCFCDKRYQLSKSLPDIFATFDTRSCLFTGFDNWMTIDIQDPSGQRIDYEIYFNLTRQSSTLLRVYVESAYTRDKEDINKRPKASRRKDKVRAKVLMAKKLRGESIRRPNNRR